MHVFLVLFVSVVLGISIGALVGYLLERLHAFVSFIASEWMGR